MKEKTTGRRKPIYYLILTVSALLLTAATVLTVYFVAGNGNSALDAAPSNPSEPNEPNEPSDPTGGEDVLQFTNPLQEVAITSGYGFYHNQTLGWFYEHEGVDIAAKAGADVLAMADGKVDSITKDELTGTQIVLSHGDGLFTLYRFVTPKEGLKVGDSVKKGDKIAVVAEPTGAEYKDGAHLHLEVALNGKNVDPTEYLTLDEK